MSAKRVVKRKSRKSKNRILSIILSVLILTVAGIVLYQYIYNKFYNRFHSFDDFSRSNSFPVRGVDVSHHNTFIDWRQLKMDNITFAYLKSTEGSDHKDRNYQENYRLARDSGIKVGAYHFYTFGKNGNEQAQHFIRNAIVKSGDLVPAIDVEHSKSNKIAQSSDIYDNIISELKKLEEALFRHFGKHPVIYTNKQCYMLYIEDNFPNNPLWICDLHNEPDSRFENWKIWQFSHTGRIKGVEDPIDLNYFRGSREAFEELFIP